MQITTVIINFQTPDLTETAVRSFKEVYPQAPLILADNGSDDEGESRELIRKLSGELQHIRPYYFEENVFHGPAMDILIKEEIDTPYTFFLDSDTETNEAGFLEKMEALITKENVYGVGQVQLINNRGFKSETGFPILLTPYMMIDTNKYQALPPFVHHGQPTMLNFREAGRQGLKLTDFPISDYIYHKWRGTADRFGYGLNWRSKVDFLLNKLGL